MEKRREPQRRTDATQITKTKSFCLKLDDLFDISVRNALVVMANDPDPAKREDRDFLIVQKTKRGGLFCFEISNTTEQKLSVLGF